MDGKNIEKLEGLVAGMIEELRRLKSENSELRKDLSQRKSDSSKTAKEGSKLKKHLNRIIELEKENKRLASGQSQVREKVGSILDQLEKADFI